MAVLQLLLQAISATWTPDRACKQAERYALQALKSCMPGDATSRSSATCSFISASPPKLWLPRCQLLWHNVHAGKSCASAMPNLEPMPHKAYS